MRLVVIVDSQFGNTEKIAEAIARGARAAGAEVELTRAADADLPALVAGRVDLMAVGGPTVSRRMTDPLSRCLDELRPHARALPIATFDTRYRGSELLMGSAAKKASRELVRAGARLVVPEESFFVVRAEAPRGQRTPPGLSTLAEGEEARAEAWGHGLVAAMG